MALIFIDGFDHYATAAEFDKKYLSTNGAVQDTTEQRTGLGCCKITGGTGNIIIQVPAKDEYVVGFAIKLNSPTASASEGLIDFYEDSVSQEVQVSLRYTGDKRFRVDRSISGASNVVLGTSADQFDLHDGWHYLEFKALIHDSLGTYEVKLDEETILSGTGADTRNNNAEANEIKHIHIQGIQVVNTGTFIDDLYVCDTTGTNNNDFLGDIEVTTIFPKGEGNLEEFTPSSGGSNYLFVDDNPPDDDTTYVESNTSGHKDSHDMDDVSSMTTILGVQLTEYARFLTGSASIKHLSRVGGTNYIGSDKVLAGTYDFHMFIWEDDPDISSAWTISGLNAAEFGMEVSS